VATPRGRKSLRPRPSLAHPSLAARDISARITSFTSERSRRFLVSRCLPWCGLECSGPCFWLMPERECTLVVLDAAKADLLQGYPKNRAIERPSDSTDAVHRAYRHERGVAVRNPTRSASRASARRRRRRTWAALGPVSQLRLRQQADPSDLVQETFLKAHRDFIHFKGASQSSRPGCGLLRFNHEQIAFEDTARGAGWQRAWRRPGLGGMGVESRCGAAPAAHARLIDGRPIPA
jgi:hypothetical protein